MSSLSLSGFFPKINPGSLSTLPSSSRIYCELTLRVSFILKGFKLLEKSPLISLAQPLPQTLEMSNSMTASG